MLVVIEAFCSIVLYEEQGFHILYMIYRYCQSVQQPNDE